MDKKDIAIAFEQSGPYVQKKVVALREPDISDIEPDKIAFLTKVIDRYCLKHDIKARWMSDLTHDFVGYDVTKLGEKIPYETFYFQRKSRQILTEQNIKYGQELARIYGSKYEPISA